MVGVGRCCFLVRRDRVFAPTRPAEALQRPGEPTQATESGGAAPERSEGASAERPEARERRSRRKRPPGAGADPEAGAHAPDRREGGNDDGGEPQRRLSVREADADACGALGCREGTDLLEVRQGGKQRVLCREHAREWIRR